MWLFVSTNARCRTPSAWGRVGEGSEVVVYLGRQQKGNRPAPLASMGGGAKNIPSESVMRFVAGGVLLAGTPQSVLL